MDQRKDDTKKTRRKTKQEEDTDSELKNQNQLSYNVQLVGQGRHKRPKGGQRQRAKILIKHNERLQKLADEEFYGFCVSAFYALAAHEDWMSWARMMQAGL